MPPPQAGQPGYSGTPLVRKLGIKDGHRLVLYGPPRGWQVHDLPPGTVVATFGPRTSPPAQSADVVVAFFHRQVDLSDAVEDLGKAIVPNGALWVAWPRRAGGHSSDITDNTVRTEVLRLGLVDVKVAALDSDWSGLKMVWRKELRPSLTA